MKHLWPNFDYMYMIVGNLNFQRNFNFASERLFFLILEVFFNVMLYTRRFITVYLIHMYSNIFIGDLHDQ